MRPHWILSILVIVVIIISGAGCVTPTHQNAFTNQTIDGITIPTTTGPPTPAEARQIAAAAYVFGYPLVFMDVWKEHQTAVPAPDPARAVAPINQLVRPYQVQQIEQLQSSTYPITDAYYIGGWFNLTKEPMVLSVPASNGRYYVMMLEDAWTNDLPSVGPARPGTDRATSPSPVPGGTARCPQT